VVAALASSGQYATYSGFGANVFVTAPSSSFRAGEFGITTTDRTGGDGYNPAQEAPPYADDNYTPTFGGTSSASPLVAGIMALGAEINPNMDVRLAKHLLARSCDMIDADDSSEASDGGWKVNGAGFHFNQNYGFGLIDADKFTQLASQYSGVTPRQVAQQNAPVEVNTAIPDGGEITATFTVPATTPLEEVLVYLNISHSFRGDVQAFLESPQGTRCRVFSRHGEDRGDGGIDWTFVCNAFWGENPSGSWKLTVKDYFQGDTGTWNSYQFAARMGEPIPVTQPQAPELTGFSPTTGPVGTKVTLTGSKLDKVTAVQFNGTDAVFTIDSSTQITTTVPNGANSGPISVTAPGGISTSTGNFTVANSPAITRLSPASGSPGTVVIINGVIFTGATAVRFNGAGAIFNVDSSVQITATVPNGATSGRVTIVTPLGTATRPVNSDINLTPPNAKFTPTSGQAGTSVTLDGANFSGVTAVRFGGQTATLPLSLPTALPLQFRRGNFRAHHRRNSKRYGNLRGEFQRGVSSHHRQPCPKRSSSRSNSYHRREWVWWHNGCTV
jgi:subtilisin-like proprotein convertase family protein